MQPVVLGERRCPPRERQRRAVACGTAGRPAEQSSDSESAPPCEEDGHEDRLRRSRRRRSRSPRRRPRGEPGAVDARARARAERATKPRRVRPVPAGSGIPGSIAGSPRPARGARSRVGARALVAACVFAHAVWRSGDVGDELPQRVLASTGYCCCFQLALPASASARLANVRSAYCVPSDERRVVPEVRARARRASSRRTAPSPSAGRSRGRAGSAAPRTSGRGRSPCRASACRPSPRRSAGRRAAAPTCRRSRPSRSSSMPAPMRRRSPAV